MAAPSSRARRRRACPRWALAGAEIVGILAPAATEDDRDALYARGFERETPIGTSGLERIVEEQVAGTPGGRLLAGTRVLADTRAAPGRARPHDDRRGRPERGHDGARRPLRRHRGDRRAHRRDPRARGYRLLGPQPPGSTFKIITTTAALEEKLVKPSTEFPIQTAAIIDGVELENANGESCGGSFADSFAHSCNSVFAPLGVEVGAEKLVETAERYGFNGDPAVPGAVPSTLPAGDDIASPLELGATAIGQGRVLATPLLLASMSQTVASGGVRRIPTVLRDGERPEPMRVTSPEIARTLERLMVGVVNYGTGTAASLAPIGVAGQDGHRRARGHDRRGGGRDRADARLGHRRLVHGLRAGEEARDRGGGAARAQRRGRRDGGAGRAGRAAGGAGRIASGAVARFGARSRAACLP